MLGSHELLVFIVAEFIELMFIFDFVITKVLELTENESEEDRHVRVVVERHRHSFLDEEHDKAVVLCSSVNRNAVQRSIEVVRIIGTANA